MLWCRQVGRTVRKMPRKYRTPITIRYNEFSSKNKAKSAHEEVSAETVRVSRATKSEKKKYSSCRLGRMNEEA